ncbi:hypothetical protein D3C76_1136630 [compost metagenome]
MPAKAVPTVPVLAPWLSEITLRLSPKASTSVSLPSTLPLGLTPGVALFAPPASMARATSSFATGASLAPWMVMFRVARSSAPALSITV